MAGDQNRKRRILNDLSQDIVPWKKPRLKSSASNFSPPFWDNLSKVWFTRNALRELDRRNSLQAHTSTEPVGILVQDLARFTRHGGPDLRRLRGHLQPSAATPVWSQSQCSQSTKATSLSSKIRRSSAYDGNFEQHLSNHNIYPEGYEFTDGRSTPELCGMDSVQQDLLAARASLSPSQFSDSMFRDFKRKNNTDSEGTLMRDVIPMITGNANIPNEGHLPFTNLKSMTKEATVKPVPDFFDGALVGAIDRAVIQELDHKIIPTKHASVPVAPNFFLEAKARNGGAVVAEIQACFDGANGSRGIYALQNYGKDQPEYDGNPYTFSSTYHSGTLKLYAHHVTAPLTPNGTPEYHMTQIDTWGMTGNINTFRRGAAAFRNARDLAKRHRDRFIHSANAKSREARSRTQRNEEDWQDAHDALQVQVADACDDNSGDDSDTRNALGPSQTEDASSNPSQASTVLAKEVPPLSFATSFTSSFGNEPSTRSKRVRQLSSPDNSWGRRSSKSRTRIPIDQLAVEEAMTAASVQPSSPGAGRQPEADSHK